MGYCPVSTLTRFLVSDDNGFNPIWNETCDFDINNPQLAMIRFILQDEDIFSDSNFLGEATYPVRCMKTGYRSIQIKNGYSEYQELASLLIHIEMRNPNVRPEFM